MTSIAENFHGVEKNITTAAESVGRNKDDVKLIAVSKTQSDEAIDDALAYGQRLFGENRVQEAKLRWETRKTNYPDLKLHLIGPLQTNKVKDAVTIFDTIETVDRENLVDELVKESAKQSRTLQYFIQVNTGDEDQKAGVLLAALPGLLAYCKKQGLPVTGLMCIPPVDDASGLHFALLKKLAERHGLPDVSMGMSNDYARAVMAGATYVRVGTALFGTRA